MGRNLEKPPARTGLILTSRDTQIIWAVYCFRFLSTDQIQLLTKSKSRTKLNDRLRELWGCDYIDRPAVQREIFAYADKRPTVHALGNKGALWLTHNKQIRFPKAVDWTAKNKNIKSGDFIKHTLGVTETMLQAETDIHTVTGLRLIDRDELWLTSPQYSPNKNKPFELPTEFLWKDGTVVRRNTVPDRPFAITDKRGEKHTRGLNFLEYDRWSESYVRSSKTQSSILQKFLGYADAYNRKLHTQLYGYNRFRVLWVIEGDDRRIDGMIEVYKNQVKDLIPAGAFLFTTVDRLKTNGFLGDTWINAKHETIALVPTVGY